MTKILGESDRRTPSMDGWEHEYRVRRDDGEAVPVMATCSRTVEVVASSSGDKELRGFVADHGRSLALEKAEAAQGRRGASVTLIGTSFGVSCRYDYADEPEVTLVARTGDQSGFEVRRPSAGSRPMSRGK